VIVLDTNVVSEPTHRAPSDTVRRWMLTQDRNELFTTAITEAEMLWGVELMPPGQRRTSLAEQIHRIFDAELANRILPFDNAAAREFPTIVMLRRKNGRPISSTDAQIAAIARAHRAILATRNFKDFEGCGIKVVNPWAVGVS